MGNAILQQARHVLLSVQLFRKRVTDVSKEEVGAASSSDDDEEAEKRRTRARLRRMQLEMQEAPIEEDEPDEDDEVSVIFIQKMNGHFSFCILYSFLNVVQLSFTVFFFFSAEDFLAVLINE